MKNDLFEVIFMCLTFFGFAGWYMAEADNEILRKELSSHTGQEVHK